MALVQTYQFSQTAAYHREKLEIARELSDFNDKILRSLQNRLDANLVSARPTSSWPGSRAGPPRQLAKAAQQDYIIALADLRSQIGIADSTWAAEPH